MKRLDKKEEGSHEHSVMKECLKIRFPTWFQSYNSPALVFYSDHSPPTHNTSTTSEKESSGDHSEPPEQQQT